MRAIAFACALTLALCLSGGCGESEPTGAGPAGGAVGLPSLTPMAGTGPLGTSTSDKFTFAVFGDSQGGGKSKRIISTIFEKLSNWQPKKPAFAFGTGDIVKGKDPRDPARYIKGKLEEYLAMAKTARLPVFNAPGNHEMDDRDDIPSERMHELYRKVVGPTYGAFDYGNARFIGLNTEDVPPKGTKAPAGGVEFSYIGDAQLEQLDADLAANTDKTHIFIMMHYPMKPYRPKDTLNPVSLAKLKKVLAKYKNISYVFASHEHQYYNPQDRTNLTTVAPYRAGPGAKPRYLVSGGAGAKIYVSESKGGFHHFLIVSVKGNDVHVSIHRVDG